MGSLKSAEAEGGAAIANVCAAASSCPKCYVNNASIGIAGCTDASGANAWVQTIEGDLDGVAPVVYCLEDAAMAPSKSDAKCEHGVSKALVKFVGAKAKCYEKCNANIASGKIPPNNCAPGATTDPKTRTCVLDPKKGAEVKATAAIDKACFTPLATAPFCYTSSGFTSGTAWVSTAEGLQDPLIAEVNCGSPSSAFLN
jgi:hypothetical protein